MIAFGDVHIASKGPNWGRKRSFRNFRFANDTIIKGLAPDVYRKARRRSSVSSVILTRVASASPEAAAALTHAAA